MNDLLNKFCRNIIEILEFGEAKNLDVPLTKVKLAIGNNAEDFYKKTNIEILLFAKENLKLIIEKKYESVFDNLSKKAKTTNEINAGEILQKIQVLHENCTETEKKIIWRKVCELIYDTSALAKLYK